MFYICTKSKFTLSCSFSIAKECMLFTQKLLSCTEMLSCTLFLSVQIQTLCKITDVEVQVLKYKNEYNKHPQLLLDLYTEQFSGSYCLYLATVALILKGQKRSLLYFYTQSCSPLLLIPSIVIYSNHSSPKAVHALT